MKPNPVYAASIRRAASIVGSYDKLAVRIGVGPRQLQRWARGLGVPSDAQFLMLVDIVLETEPAPAAPHSHSIVAGGLDEMS